MPIPRVKNGKEERSRNKNGRWHAKRRDTGKPRGPRGK